MRLAILGPGLIGGSIARAVRERPNDDGSWTVVGWSPSGRSAAEAVAAGALDAAAPTLAEAVAEANLIVIAAPPLAVFDILDQLADPSIGLGPDAVVTDVASTKAAIVARATDLGLPFVGGHPMAGRERSGFAAAEPDLFVDRPWVVTPSPAAPAGALGRVEELVRRCGAQPVVMDATTHDRAVAGISHLPLLLAVALVETVTTRDDRAEALRLAASGWRDTTRLARGDPDMAAGIAITNRAELMRAAVDLRAVLDDWIAILAASSDPDGTALRERFEAARRALGEGDAADG